MKGSCADRVTSNSRHLLEVENLTVKFPVKRNLLGQASQYAHVVNDVSFSVAKGATFGIIGESGSGKSTLARTIAGLYGPSSGRIQYNGADIGHLNHRARKQQGVSIDMVFQDPKGALNAKMPIWEIITESQRIAGDVSKADRWKRSKELASEVGIPQSALERYPNALSGGQRQRIAIARSLCSSPDLLILDEPTSALDVSLQAQVLNLLKDLQVEHGLTYLLISHDMGVVRYMCSDVAVMYLGQIQESAASDQLFSSACHPYTRQLLSMTPSMVGQSKGFETMGLLDQEVEVPSNRVLPTGCFYQGQCPDCEPGCSAPQRIERHINKDDHQVRCHLVGNAKGA